MRHSLALILLLTLTACSHIPAPKENQDEAVEKLYADAKEELDNNNYDKAVKSFEDLQSRYPYGRYAQQALLESAYANFKQQETEPALAAADRFIKEFPNNPHVDYAYYLKGLINFNEDLGVLASIVKQDLSQRDPNSMREAFDAFKVLITRFPDSQYVPDAKIRMQYLINTLARYEINIASYYLRRGAYVAAANRAKGVLTDYSQTPVTRDALQIMIQAYDAMGMTDLRDDAKRVLDKSLARDGAMAPLVRLSPQNAKKWWEFWK